MSGVFLPSTFLLFFSLLPVVIFVLSALFSRLLVVYLATLAHFISHLYFYSGDSECQCVLAVEADMCCLKCTRDPGFDLAKPLTELGPNYTFPPNCKYYQPNQSQTTPQHHLHALSLHSKEVFKKCD